MTRDELKKVAGEMLAAAGVKPNTKKGNDMIWAFYIGHYAGRDLPPYVAICMMSGRHDELVEVSE